jgi:hypothetical protein
MRLREKFLILEIGNQDTVSETSEAD